MIGMIKQSRKSEGERRQRDRRAFGEVHAPGKTGEIPTGSGQAQSGLGVSLSSDELLHKRWDLASDEQKARACSDQGPDGQT